MKTSLMIVAAFAAAPALAALPPAPEAAKEQAKESAAKSAWGDKVSAYQLCRAQDRTAEAYRKSHAGSPPAQSTPPCVDPGPYVSPAAAKPLEASEAHSPPATATSPPSSNATAGQLQGKQ